MPSSPIVVTLEPVCHAGGRGFESRRSRKTPWKSRMLCCQSGRQNLLDYTNARSDGYSIRPEPAEYASESHGDKPFAAASRLTAKAARDYTK